MNFEESLNFLKNYLLISPVLCYLIFTLQLIYKRYSNNASTDQILEQEKLIKEFRTKFTKSSLNQNIQNRELFAQKISKKPNISGRFIAFALKHEIPNINYIIYLLSFSSDFVKVPDIEGNNYLKIIKPKCEVVFKGMGSPLIIGIITLLFINFNYLYEPLSSIWIYAFFFIVSVILLSKGFPYLAVYLFEKHAEFSDYNEKKCRFQKLCYLIECAMSKSGSSSMSVKQILKKLETKQIAHDDRYHKDVWVLSTQGKVKHMAAHIGKYSGQILEQIRDPQDLVKVRKYVLDSLIINFSYANIFTYRLSNHLAAAHLQLSSLDDLRNSIAQEYLSRKGYTKAKVEHGLDLAMDMCILASQILKSVESLDHVEDHPFRPNFNKYTVEIFEILITLAYIYDISNIDALISDRMYEVENRHEFFDDYGNYKDGYKDIK
ncbi:hypothetical protein PTT44_07020 [Acinetobacter sp. Gutcm_16]|uniref:hypothetical protein n=1 Tax=Acinetobacter sp. Gutcm_16 TaxID=3026087 RepID=UPI00235DCFD5|nr:hypothetical protein [Acinetobacter sp. Gutcm_16]MDD0802320.1 hypothetical protein [Acinetobacter sp. Gutcm_16]